MKAVDQLANLNRTPISISEFNEYPEVHCQRNTELRVDKTAKLLKNFNLRHLEVAVGEYPDGTRVVLDGNTRRLAWQLYGDKLYVPPFVSATVYPVENDIEAEKLYETFDSSLAVENSKHKIQSALRTVWGAEYEIRSNPFIKGYLTTALRAGTEVLKDAQTGKRAKWKKDSIENIRRVVSHYSNELKRLDMLIEDTVVGNQSMYGAALIALKAYGVNNRQLLKGLNKWFSNDYAASYEKYNGAQVDGICWLTRYANNNTFYAEKMKSTRADDAKYVVGLYLYCIDQFMAGKTMRHTVNEAKILDYFERYGKKNNFEFLGETKVKEVV